MENRENRDARGIRRWFNARGMAMCCGGWCSLRDLKIDCVLYTEGCVRCSDREFALFLMGLGCESKRVSGGMVYRLVCGSGSECKEGVR